VRRNMRLSIAPMMLWLAAVLAGCGDAGEGAADMLDDQPPILDEIDDMADVEEITGEIFMREPAAGSPGRLTIHILVAPEASSEQIRQLMVRALTEEGRDDPDLVALRAVVYKARQTSEYEADLVEAGWGEWLPPEGWDGAGPASRGRFHRVYTYFGSPPQW
jgi:hypothetical protein